MSEITRKSYIQTYNAARDKFTHALGDELINVIFASIARCKSGDNKAVVEPFDLPGMNFRDNEDLLFELSQLAKARAIFRCDSPTALLFISSGGCRWSCADFNVMSTIHSAEHLSKRSGSMQANPPSLLIVDIEEPSVLILTTVPANC